MCSRTRCATMYTTASCCGLLEILFRTFFKFHPGSSLYTTSSVTVVYVVWFSQATTITIDLREDQHAYRKASCFWCRNVPEINRPTVLSEKPAGTNFYICSMWRSIVHSWALNRSCRGGVGNRPSQHSHPFIDVRSRDGKFLIHRLTILLGEFPGATNLPPAEGQSGKIYFPAREHASAGSLSK